MKFMKEKHFEKILFYIMSFFIPVLIWIAVCFLNKIYPFGNSSIMTGDITYQFIDYLSYFKTIVLGNNDLTYTFSKTIGGDMAGFAAYYLFSPFNFLLLPFPKSILPLGLLIMIIIKCGMMSLCFMFMMEKIYGFDKKQLAFAVTYSLMGYVIVYFQLYAYFDDMMLMPLIVVGIHKILENPRKKIMYIITLFLAISINYYIGWMMCIFSAVYFMYRWILSDRKKETIISFFIGSVISGLLSAVILIPSILSLQGEKNSFHIGFYRTMSLADFFSRFYTNSFKGNISSCLPNVYCGVLVVFFVALYMLNEKFSIKKRLLSLALITFFIINFYFNTFNVIWHGLNRPIG